jgi:uncharacterized membrane protein
MIIFWVIGAPLFVLIILIKNRNNLEDPSIQRYYLVLYQGLKPEVFYWEFVNTMRKVIMPLSSVVLSTASGFYRAMIAVLILIIIFRVQQKLKPYKLEENNQIEIFAIMAGMLTLFGALLFIESSDGDTESVAFLQTFSLICIMCINVYFILRWVHLFLY